VNGEVHGGRPRPTGAVVPRKKKKKNLTHGHAVRAEGNGAANDNTYYEEQTVSSDHKYR
jgi:hypothetical protein